MASATDDVIYRRNEQGIVRQASEYEGVADKVSFIDSKCRMSANEPNVYIPIMNTTYEDENGWLKKVEIGRKNRLNSGVKEKVILLVGATGAGKTTTINAMANYFLGITFRDNFRIKLIDEKTAASQDRSQTRCITSYTIHYQPWFSQEYTLTIVDTPGFGDTEGPMRDREISEQMKIFFDTKGPGGIDQLDAVGFVSPSSLPRLTLTQRYIFDSVLEKFGNDIKDNIFMFFTFAEGATQPMTLAAVKAAEVPHVDFFKFNFGDLFNTTIDDEDDSEEAMWKRMNWSFGIRSFQKFFQTMNKTTPKTLTLTREVLKERSELEDALNCIQENVTISIIELEKLEKEQEVLEVCKGDMEKNKDHKYQFKEQYVELEPLDKEFTAINCKTCNVTCLKTKYQWNDAILSECWLFRDRAGFGEPKGCNKCPAECDYSKHHCGAKWYAFKTRLVTRTVEELKRNYEEAQEKEMTAEQIIAECEERIEEVKEETRNLVKKAKLCMERLDQIALKPDPISINDYIDLMIEAERRQSGAELGKRVETLVALKRRETSKKSMIGDNFKSLEEEMQLVMNPIAGGCNMTHQVVMVEKKDGHFMGRMKRIFKKIKRKKKPKSVQENSHQN